MSECDAFAGIEIESLNELECSFLLDVLAALTKDASPLPAVRLRAAHDSLDQVRARLMRLVDHGLATSKSRIESGHLVPKFTISDLGVAVLVRSNRAVA